MCFESLRDLVHARTAPCISQHLDESQGGCCCCATLWPAASWTSCVSAVTSTFVAFVDIKKACQVEDVGSFPRRGHQVVSGIYLPTSFAALCPRSAWATRSQLLTLASRVLSPLVQPFVGGLAASLCAAVLGVRLVDSDPFFPHVWQLHADDPTFNWPWKACTRGVFVCSSRLVSDPPNLQLWCLVLSEDLVCHVLWDIACTGNGELPHSLPLVSMAKTTNWHRSDADSSGLVASCTSVLAPTPPRPLPRHAVVVRLNCTARQPGCSFSCSSSSLSFVLAMHTALPSGRAFSALFHRGSRMVPFPFCILANSAFLWAPRWLSQEAPPGPRPARGALVDVPPPCHGKPSPLFQPPSLRRASVWACSLGS